MLAAWGKHAKQQGIYDKASEVNPRAVARERGRST
jgi:hypothetical protein